jgi:transcriptional regulator with XRE-family HTH domain
MLHLKLKEARERLGISPEKVEKLTEVSYPNIYKYESGEIVPTIKTLRKLQPVYNIPIKQLIAWRALSLEEIDEEVIEYLKIELRLR